MCIAVKAIGPGHQATTIILNLQVHFYMPRTNFGQLHRTQSPSFVIADAVI